MRNATLSERARWLVYSIIPSVNPMARVEVVIGEEESDAHIVIRLKPGIEHLPYDVQTLSIIIALIKAVRPDIEMAIRLLAKDVPPPLTDTAMMMVYAMHAEALEPITNRVIRNALASLEAPLGGDRVSLMIGALLSDIVTAHDVTVPCIYNYSYYDSKDSELKQAATDIRSAINITQDPNHAAKRVITILANIRWPAFETENATIPLIMGGFTKASGREATIYTDYSIESRVCDPYTPSEEAHTVPQRFYNNGGQERTFGVVEYSARAAIRQHPIPFVASYVVDQGSLPSPHVVICVDVSSSMKGARFEEALAAAKGLARSIRVANGHVRVCMFSDVLVFDVSWGINGLTIPFRGGGTTFTWLPYAMSRNPGYQFIVITDGAGGYPTLTRTQQRQISAVFVGDTIPDEMRKFFPVIASASEGGVARVLSSLARIGRIY